MAFADFTYDKWLGCYDKDDLRFYANWDFKAKYTSNQMERKAKGCYCTTYGQMFDLIQSLQPNPNLTSWRDANSWLDLPPLRILSLGCGPGTDLLAATWACVKIGGVRMVECTGVDLYKWPTDEFKKHFNAARENSPGEVSMYWSMYQADAAKYVEDCIGHGLKFDLVISSYARAVDNMNLLGEKAPQVLDQFGRIFVIDNNSYDLKNGLQQKGFCLVAEKIDGKLIFLVYQKPCYVYN